MLGVLLHDLSISLMHMKLPRDSSIICGERMPRYQVSWALLMIAGTGGMLTSQASSMSFSS